MNLTMPYMRFHTENTQNSPVHQKRKKKKKQKTNHGLKQNELENEELMVGNFMFFVDQIQVEPGLEEALAQ